MLEKTEVSSFTDEELMLLESLNACTSQSKHFYIFLLFKIQSIGIQTIICEKLEYMQIRNEIPQLIEIMLKGCDMFPISYPIYRLLFLKSSKDIGFRIDLFLRLKSILSTVEDKKAKYCYFLCFEIIEIDNIEYKRNLNGLKSRLKYSFRNKSKFNIPYRRFARSRTFSVFKKHKTPCFQGIVLFFAKAISSILSEQFYSEFDKYCKVFNSKKIFKVLNFKSVETDFKSNIRFLENIVDIANRLRALPKSLRLNALRIELGLANYELQNNIIDPLNNKKYILNFILEHCITLDSAENCPFLVLIECASVKAPTDLYLSNRYRAEYSGHSKFRKCKILLNQLQSLNDLGDIGDIDGVKESMIKAMENIMFDLNTKNNINERCNCIDKVDKCNCINEVDKVTCNDKGFNCNCCNKGKDSNNNCINERDKLNNNCCNEGGQCINEDERRIENPVKNLPVNIIMNLNESVGLENRSSVDLNGRYCKERDFRNEVFGSVKYKSVSSINLIGAPETNIHDKSQLCNIKKNDLINYNEEEINHMQKSIVKFVSPFIEESQSKTIENYGNNFIDSESLVFCDDVYYCDMPNAQKLINKTNSTISNIKEKLYKTSKYACLPGWEIKSFIVKSGGILKHEYIAYQILTQMKEIFITEKLPIYLKNYKIILVSDTSGLIETVQDSLSIHRIKADLKYKTLLEYFTQYFQGDNLLNAKNNFLYSLVGYSLASYLLQIKDRHNGNILIDSFGHIVHVDFGFILGKYPGIFSVENAPFKISADYLELIDLEAFRKIFIRGFQALRKHYKKLTCLVEIMEDTGYCDKFTFIAFKDRLRLLDNDRDFETYCNSLIAKSTKNMGTMVYDQIQYFSNGYL